MRSEVNSDRQFSIDGIVSIHLGIERPLCESVNAGQVEPTIFRGHQNHERSFRRFADKNAGFHPVIDFLSLQRRRHGGPRGVLGDRTKLLIFVQPESMHVHGFQNLHVLILQMIRLMGEIVDLAPYKRGAHCQQGTRHHEKHPNEFHSATFLYLSSLTESGYDTRSQLTRYVFIHSLTIPPHPSPLPPGEREEEKRITLAEDGHGAHEIDCGLLVVVGYSLTSRDRNLPAWG